MASQFTPFIKSTLDLINQLNIICQDSGTDPKTALKIYEAIEQSGLQASASSFLQTLNKT